MNNAAAIERSHEPIEKFCIECREPFYTPRNNARRSHRCPPCQHEHAAEMARERAQNQIRNRPDPWPSIGGRFRILRDPQETWTPNGSLDLGDIKRLAERGHLDAGMVWSDGARAYAVVQAGDTLRLQCVAKGD